MTPPSLPVVPHTPDRGRPDGLVERLHRAAASAPDRVAVRCTSGHLTYRELDAAVERLASRLVAAGVGAGDVVAVSASRHHRTLEALLAVRAAGAAYVPLEPTLPAPRIDAILGESEPRLCLVPDPDDVPDVAGVPLAGLDDAQPATPGRASAPVAGDLAYVIFTSGSTGRPKGVQIAESSVLALLDHMAREPGLAAGETMLGLTTPAFDLSVPDLYLPLSVAATLEFAPRPDTVDGIALRRLVERCAPDLVQATPSTWRLLLAAGWDGRAAMRVVCGGEGYEAALASDLAVRVGEVWNCYGPTETTVWSVMGRLGRAERDPIPMGRPIAGTDCRVVAADGSPVAPGDIGELVIGGAGVSRGYLNRPDLDAASFVDGGSGPDARAFRTGDFVRTSTDGTLSFVERRDDQVKLRGYRIELGDVESALRSLAGVRQAAAVVVDTRLVAFVTGEVAAGGLTGDGPPAPTGDDVVTAAAELLPAHMVPAVVVVAETLPLTPNGKLDRAALRVLAADAGRAEAAASTVAFDDPVEALIAELWDEVLPAAVRSPDDDFFSLGGDSLAATRMVARTAERFGVTVGVAELFEAPTLTAFAAAVAELLLADDDVGTLT